MKTAYRGSMIDTGGRTGKRVCRHQMSKSVCKMNRAYAGLPWVVEFRAARGPEIDRSEFPLSAGVPLGLYPENDGRCHPRLFLFWIPYLRVTKDRYRCAWRRTIVTFFVCLWMSLKTSVITPVRRSISVQRETWDDARVPVASTTRLCAGVFCVAI